MKTIQNNFNIMFSTEKKNSGKNSNSRNNNNSTKMSNSNLLALFDEEEETNGVNMYSINVKPGFETKVDKKVTKSISELEPDGKTPDGEEDPEEKKKPKGEDEDEDTDEASEDLECLNDSDLTTKSRKSKLRKSLIKSSKYKSVQVLTDSSKQELTDVLKDALKAAENAINDKRLNEALSTGNGSAKQLISLLKPLSDQMFMLLASVQTTGYRVSQIPAEDYNVLRDIKGTVDSVIQPQTATDQISTIMSLRNLYLTLSSTNRMIQGEINLVDNLEMFRTFRIFGDVDANDRDIINLSRDSVGDTSIEPDIAIIKPMFLFFVDDKLRRSLTDMGISPRLIRALGNYSIPSLFNGNSNTDTNPEEENLTFSSLSRISRSDNAKVTHSFPDFVWSNNGVDSIRQKSIMAYKSRNEKFINEIQELFNTMNSHNFKEFSYDVCFSIVLTNWLNAAYKVLVESHTHISELIQRGVATDMDRMVGLSGPAIASYLLDSITFNVSENKSTNYMGLIEDAINNNNVISMTKKLTYSEFAYKSLVSAYKSVTYVTTSDLNYYIGETKIGQHKQKVVVAPKLYLPVNIADNTVNYHMEVKVRKAGAINNICYVKDIFSYRVPLIKIAYSANRDSTEAGEIVNISILHTLANMTNAQYKSRLDAFYAANYITKPKGEEISFTKLFGAYDNVSHGLLAADKHMGFPRLWSSIAPFYMKNAILGLNPITIGDVTESTCVLAPFIDQLANGTYNINKDVSGTNYNKIFSTADYLKAIMNYHTDFSWIESWAVLSRIYMGYCHCVNTLVSGEDSVYPTDLLDSEGIPILSSESEYYQIPSITFLTSPSSDSLVQSSQEAVTTVMRRASYIFDEGKYKIKVTRFNNNLDVSPSGNSSMISTNDIMKAFKFVAYNKGTGGYYLIDNNNPFPNMSRKTWFNIVSGEPDLINSIIPSEVAVNIKADDIKNEILTQSYISGNLLIYDRFNSESSKLSYDVSLIPSTNLIGYRFGNSVSREKVLKRTSDGSGKYLNFNKYCYINDDFYPTFIKFTNVIPCNTGLFRYVTETTKASTLDSMSNGKFFEILGNFFHNIGVDNGNMQGFRVLLQSAFGIRPMINTRSLISDNIDETLLANGYNDENYMSLTDSEGIGDESNINYFKSSFRYPQFAIVPTSQVISGLCDLPPIEDEDFELSYDTSVSMSLSQKFFSKFGSILPNYQTSNQTYTRDKGEAFLYALNQRIQNANLTNADNDLVIDVTIRNILNAIGMEDK